MQTFLPYPDFEQSVRVLDYRRLGKQRGECLQLLKALGNIRDVDLSDVDMTIPAKGWVNHPAAKMWRGYEGALAHYHDACILEWQRRGYQNTMRLRGKPDAGLEMPPWFGDARFHASHRSNLLRKDPAYYAQFGWKEPADMEYVWPV